MGYGIGGMSFVPHGTRSAQSLPSLSVGMYLGMICGLLGKVRRPSGVDATAR